MERNLSKYFHLGVAKDDVSDADARRFVNDPAARGELIERCLSRGTLATLFAVAARQIDRDRPPVPEPLALAHKVMEASTLAWREKRLNATDESTLLIYNVVRSVDRPQRFEVLKAIAADTVSVSVSERLVLELMKHAELWPPAKRGKLPPGAPPFTDDQLIPREDLDELRLMWVETAWSVGLEKIFETEPQSMSIVFRLGQLCSSQGEDYGRVQREMDQFLNDSSHLVQFVSAFSVKVRGASYAIDGTDKLVSNFGALLERIIQLSEPADAVVKFRVAHNRQKGLPAQGEDEAGY